MTCKLGEQTNTFFATMVPNVWIASRDPKPASSEISDLTPCAHGQGNILHTKYAEKSDDLCLGIHV